MGRRSPRNTTTVARRMGRRSLFSPQVADTIVEWVEGGNSVTTACLAAGITTNTLYRWIRKAEDAEEAAANGEPYDAQAAELCTFRDRLGLARARASTVGPRRPCDGRCRAAR